MNDDPFELAPIIKVVMNEQKGKKRGYQEVEYSVPCLWWEPKNNRSRKSLFLEAEETSLKGSPKTP